MVQIARFVSTKACELGNMYESAMREEMQLDRIEESVSIWGVSLNQCGGSIASLLTSQMWFQSLSTKYIHRVW